MQDDSGIQESMDPDEIFLRGALHQVFETDWHVSQLASQGLSNQRVLSDLQTLPTRVATDFALINARLDQLAEALLSIEATVREVGAVALRGQLNLPNLDTRGARCSICSQSGHTWRICPVLVPGHKCERCLEPDHLEIR